MITPEGTGSGGKPSRPGRATVIGGALLVVGGLIALGAFTSPDPEAITDSTTTTVEEPSPIEEITIEEIAMGEPLQFGLSMAVDDAYPLAVLEHEGTLHLFAAPAPGTDPRGLRAWRSPNGVDWTALGDVISADYRITAIASTTRGLVAAGNRLEDGGLTAFLSDDGMEWSYSPIPVDTRDSYTLTTPLAVGATNDTVVVSTEARFDGERLLEERLASRGLDMELSVLDWSVYWQGEGGHYISVEGPLGVPIVDTSLDDLGLSDEEQEQLDDMTIMSPGTSIWARDRETGWREVVLEDAFGIYAMAERPDGRLMGTGLGVAGPIARVTDDGREWSPADSGTIPARVQWWGSRLAGIAGFPGPELLVSDDGDSWQSAGLAEHFPSELNWSVRAFGAGDGGVALVAESQVTTDLTSEAGQLELTTSEGWPLILDFEERFIQVNSNAGRYRWSFPGRAASEEGVEVDLETETIVLFHPETGVRVAEIAFEEIGRAEDRYLASQFDSSKALEALVFTDGEGLTIQDMAGEIGDHSRVRFLEVGEDRAVAIVRSTIDDLAPNPSPGFEVWSASVP